MRYHPEHKADTHKRIVEDASRRFRSDGLSGAALTSIMRDSGLTHGGFYKHFDSKDELLVESLRQAFHEIGARLTDAARDSKPGEAWKAIVKFYLSPQHCDHPEYGCPVAALSTELARADKKTRAKVLRELKAYQDEIVPWMPGRGRAEKERAFLSIYSTMVGAISMARLLPDPKARIQVLETARDFLLRSFP
jgi:TetR/AcrR family transcriptional repressor of nem operon